MEQVATIILAAGEGTRMRSNLTKILHPLAGKQMIRHVVEQALHLGSDPLILVTGHQRDLVQEALEGEKVTLVHQESPLGTGHAVDCCRAALRGFTGTLLVTCGDTPLLTAETLAGLIEAHRSSGADATVLTAPVEDPTGYGRIVRSDDGEVLRIVEEKEGTAGERALREINSGVYAFRPAPLWAALQLLLSQRQEGEYYLTDVVALLREAGATVRAHGAADPVEILGINTRVHLAIAERALRRRVRERLMLTGVTLMEPETIFVDDSVSIGPDTILYPGVIVEGSSSIGPESVIGPYCRIIDSVIGRGVELKGWNYVVKATIASGAILEPHARRGLGA